MRPEPPRPASHPQRQRALMAGAAALTLPGLALRLTAAHPVEWLAAVAFGMAIVGAAFLLAWAAEAVQLDVSQGLALALLALIVVLLASWRIRRIASAQGYEGELDTDVELDRAHSIEIAFLAVATLYSLTLPLKSTLTLVDAAVLVFLFLLYV